MPRRDAYRPQPAQAHKAAALTKRKAVPRWQTEERVGLADVGLCVTCGTPLVSLTGEIVDMECARCHGFDSEGRVDHAAWLAARRGDAA